MSAYSGGKVADSKFDREALMATYRTRCENRNFWTMKANLTLYQGTIHQATYLHKKLNQKSAQISDHTLELVADLLTRLTPTPPRINSVLT